ncbi:MAG: ABC transporter substrate-binding protein [Clostridia bacterium]|nr:ABC transporter substrate-binding protein [Clostridia bacterium]
MKEKIYTIPVNEAYDKDCECPLCELEKQLEHEAIEYALGAAMMEPDYRVESNEKGYCNRHFSQMFDAKNKLPLALVLETHLMELRKKLDGLQKTASAAAAGKSGLFKKNTAAELAASEMANTFGKVECECMVCQKINRTTERYIDVLLYMWANEDEFRAKFDRSKGVCLKHFKMLCEAAPKSIKADAGKFLAALAQKEKAELDRIQDDIHRFTLKFDYRNKDMEWGTAQDAPLRTIEKISGYITPYDEKENG